MGDMRCANPEYQLDVDSMTLEHTLYHAIDAKLKYLKAAFVDKDDHDDVRDLRDTAIRLVETYDTLIRLFKHHHPNSVSSEGTTFNIKILEFLVLIDQLITQVKCSVQLETERVSNTCLRREWLKSWAADKEEPGRDIKLLIDNGIDSCTIEDTNHVTLNDVLTQFLKLSAEVAEAMGDVSENWYQLAAQFMLQAAAERTMFFVGRNGRRDLSTPQSERDLVIWTSECFAWGIVHPWPLTSHFSQREGVAKMPDRHVQDEMFIRNMFRSPDEAEGTRNTKDKDGDVEMANDSTASQSFTENPRWTKVRTKYHHEIFHNVMKMCDDVDVFVRNGGLDQLYKRYPLEAFLARLIDFIEGIWFLNVSNVSGKPVLVQIEEGHLEGLDRAEYKSFLDRVGLKLSTRADGKPAVKWAR